MLLHPIAVNICPPSVDNLGWAYRHPISGIPFRSMALNVMLIAIRNHVKGMNYPMPHNWEHLILDEICRQGNYNCEPNPKAEGYEAPLITQGRALWNELHEYSKTVPEAPTEPEKAEMQTWFSGWVARCPRYSGCACYEGLLRALSVRQPDYSSRQGFFSFCVELHSDISESIGKARWHVTGTVEASP